MYNASTLVKEIVNQHPSAIRLFDRLGIDYCCGGGRSIEAACAAASLKADSVLEQVSQCVAMESPGESKDFQTMPLAELTQYIVEQHHAFTREELPRLLTMAQKLASKHGDRYPQAKEIERLIFELWTEMNSHMMKEEQLLFPYIDDLARAAAAGEVAADPFFGTIACPIGAMEEEHEAAGALIAQLAKATDGYTPAVGACMTHRGLYFGLAEFERDLHMHVHLENNVLFPRALALENAQRKGEQAVLTTR